MERRLSSINIHVVRQSGIYTVEKENILSDYQLDEHIYVPNSCVSNRTRCIVSQTVLRRVLLVTLIKIQEFEKNGTALTSMALNRNYRATR